ncbi:hypothetical protein [Phocoenobacter skyensis]|uniref:hypothetical protein n=1 Tax=Phocoenobacter skyensis TaxID=97481 RepID=UPI00276F12EA|nr:hypothetical protein [Pasteurella skyensis]MDP8185306.1 hypothetical protein [Pasteurella skyensis]
MISLPLNKHDLSMSFDNWVSLYEYLVGGDIDCLNELDESVWEFVRHYSFKDAPIIENVYQRFLLENLVNAIENKYPELTKIVGVSIRYFINSLCSSIDIYDERQGKLFDISDNESLKNAIRCICNYEHIIN